MTSTATVDYDAVKIKQQATWATGDYSAIAARIVLVAEQLCDTADLRAGWHVLDVATGSGNAAIAAARHGCDVVGIDRFGESAPAGELFKEFGFTVDNVVKAVKSVL